jgi:hypothetical protein
MGKLCDRAGKDCSLTNQAQCPLQAGSRENDAAFRVHLEHAGDELWAEVVYWVPRTREARNLAERFEKHGDSYLRFITTPGIEPTNNLAEQAIRFVVIDRKVTQGSRGPTGYPARPFRKPGESGNQGRLPKNP